jgi:hypothetical protein
VNADARWWASLDAGQTTITLTGLHAYFGKAKTALMRVSAQLQAWSTRAAEQFNPITVWTLVCEHLKRTLAGIRPPQSHRFLPSTRDARDRELLVIR